MEHAELPQGLVVPASYGVSDPWTVTKRLKTQESLVKAIKDRLPENECYKGDSKGFRTYFLATISVLTKTGLQELVKNIKSMPEEPLTQEQWDALYSRTDLQLIYDVVLATVAVSAHNIVNNTEENGLNSLTALYRLWGAQTVSNSISAFTDILSLKVEKHSDPAPTFQKLEELLADFFPGLSDNIKIAILLRIVDTNKYRTIIDQQDTTTYAKLKLSIQSYYLRKNAEYASSSSGNSTERNSGPKVFNTSVNSGSPTLKRKQYCKSCRKLVDDHTTITCPLANKGVRKPQQKTHQQRRQNHNNHRNHQQQQQQQKQPKDKSHIQCYNCGNFGHYMNECNKPKKQDNASVKTTTRTDAGVTLSDTEE